MVERETEEKHWLNESNVPALIRADRRASMCRVFPWDLHRAMQQRHLPYLSILYDGFNQRERSIRFVTIA